LLQSHPKDFSTGIFPSRHSSFSELSRVKWSLGRSHGEPRRPSLRKYPFLWSWLEACGEALQKLNRISVNRIFPTRLFFLLFVPRSYRFDSYNVTPNLLVGKFSIWEMTWIVSDWSGKSVLINHQVYRKTFLWFIPPRLDPLNHVISQVNLPFAKIRAIGFLFWPICVRHVSSVQSRRSKADIEALLKVH